MKLKPPFIPDCFNLNFNSKTKYFNIINKEFQFYQKYSFKIKHKKQYTIITSQKYKYIKYV